MASEAVKEVTELEKTIPEEVEPPAAVEEKSELEPEAEPPIVVIEAPEEVPKKKAVYKPIAPIIEDYEPPKRTILDELQLAEDFDDDETEMDVEDYTDSDSYSESDA